MAGQRRLDRDLHGFEIPDLADHDDVRVLPQDGAPQACEMEPHLRLHLDLVDAVQLILHQVLDGDDIAGDRVQLQEAGIERGGLAAASRAGHQHHAVRQIERALDPLPDVVRQTELCKVELDGGAVEDAQDDLFAVQRRDRRNPEIDLMAAHRQLDTAVLRQSAFGNVEPCHDLDARDYGGLKPRRRRLDLVQYAVISIPYPQPVRKRLEMDIGGMRLN